FVAASYLFNCTHPIELGHAQIEQRDVRSMLGPKLNGFASVARFGENGHVSSASDQRSQTFTHHAVIVSNEDADTRLLRRRCRFLASFAGFPRNFLRHQIDPAFVDNRTVIFVPRPRALAIFNLPPICSTRSRIPASPKPSDCSSTVNPLPSS